jgi:hypothetical protein
MTSSVAPIRTGRQAPAQGLRERDHVGDDPEVLRRPARGDRQTRLYLVEDQDDAVAACDLAHRLEVARLGQDDPEVHHRRLHDQAGGLASFAIELGEPPLEGGGVVERNCDRQVDDRLRDPFPVRERVRRLVRADRVVLDTDRDHHGVVVAVV